VNRLRQETVSSGVEKDFFRLAQRNFAKEQLPPRGFADSRLEARFSVSWLVPAAGRWPRSATTPGDSGRRTQGQGPGSDAADHALSPGGVSAAPWLLRITRVAPGVGCCGPPGRAPPRGRLICVVPSCRPKPARHSAPDRKASSASAGNGKPAAQQDFHLGSQSQLGRRPSRYIRTKAGWRYLAVFDRSVQFAGSSGWKLDSRIDYRLVTGAHRASVIARLNPRSCLDPFGQGSRIRGY